MQVWDMSIFKNIPFGERYSVQLRLEAFNAFNHPNFVDKNFGVNVNGPFQWQPGTPFSISKNATWGTYSNSIAGGGG